MNNHLSVLEALLFASDSPLPADRLAEISGLPKPEEVGPAIDQLNQKYQDYGHSIRIREIAGGYQIYTLPEFSPWIEALFQKIKKQRLSKAALESLSIVAYRQPVTKIDIDQIRGVQSDAALKTLLERELITVTGRAHSVGRPLLYGTTDQFLIHFGLKDLSELPKLEEMEFVTGPAPAIEPVLENIELPLSLESQEMQATLSDPS
ncbi:MAG: SMC-Scp complex subunit ScpB [candidate division Zixibacteria bacterium RBG_16_50_21]|nr:MAG: SMC-Scp complex subunit ScpB [candidate division Zixibacteria bacterium RBG_16_50_21]